ncbi:MAG: VCBS repeat-containing protein [Planctomycetota bacterium]|nr:MAG: VCBS repeat-containing protein [Planctomycetota bacterium]
MVRDRAALLVCVLSGSAAGAGGPAAYEVSEDGHRSAVIGFSATDGTGWVARGGSVPFGTAPDQVVEIRRQIGGLQIADVDGDGNNDLVAVCYISNSFPPYEQWDDMIFFGTGAGIQTTPGWLSSVETHTGDVQVGDINGDGNLDIVTIHGGGLRRDSVRVYFGTGSGPSVTPGYVSNTAATSWGTSGVLADMDQDGDLDLVTTNQGLSPDPFRPMLMFDNTGTTLTSAAVWQSAEQSIQNGIDARDVTGEGYPDLAVAKWVNFRSGLYLNQTGTPDVDPSETVDTTGADKGAAFSDIDGDGFQEVVFGGDNTKAYEIGFGVLTPFYEANPPFSGPQDIRMFDVDGDGDEDLGEIYFSDGRAHIYINRDGVLDTDPTWTFDAPEVGNAMAFGDLNGDGLADMALGYAGNTCVRVFFAQAPECPADMAEPFGVLNIFDIQAFIGLYNGQDAGADLAEPFGVFNIFDLQAYIDLYNQGCP